MRAIASVEADYAAALDAIPDGTPKRRASSIGHAAAAVILALRVADGSDTPFLDSDYPQGTKPGEYRFTPGFSLCLRAGMGECHALRAQRQRPVPPGAALCRHQ